MRQFFGRESGSEAASRLKRRPGAFLGFLVLAVVSVVAWVAPAQKPNAVLGRLDYLQFWGAVFVSGCALSLGGVALARPAGRRRAGFRVAAVWAGLALALGAVRLIAWFLPVHPMDNPWYLSAGGGLAQADDLPFGRPAHLKWTGRSRGDLAMLNGDPDPNGRVVTFETDRDGFRNEEDIHQADVITIGDSFTEAGNVPQQETFSALVGDRLGKSVRNLGRAGYSSPSELVVLRKFGLECGPELVIWQIAGANDLAEAFMHEKWVARGRPNYQVAKAALTRAQAWERRSPTFQVFSMLRELDARPWPFSGVFRDSQRKEHRIRFLYSAGVMQPALHHPGWKPFTNAVARGARLCRSNKVHLLLLFIPDKARVFEEYTRFARRVAERVPHLAGLESEPSFGQMLGSFCAARGIAYVNATEGLRKRAAKGKLVYQPFDTHLSRQGHQLVADLIVQKLRRLNWR